MTKTYIIHQDTDNGYINKNLHYLIGIEPSLGTAILENQKIYLIFDARYINSIKKRKKTILETLNRIYGKTFEIEFILLNTNIESLLQNYLIGKEIILENNIPTCFHKKILKLEIKEIDFVDNIFEKERIIKTQLEMKYIKKAINIINKVYKKIFSEKDLLIGKREYEVRKIIVQLIQEYGGEGESFKTIVAFGKNSSIPHHEAGKTIIGNGPLLIDMGAIYKGYCSDFTRTFWVGEKTSNYSYFIQIQKIVKDAHDVGIKYVKESTNVTGKKLDFVVRQYIEKSGFGKYFTHSTGHGVGLQIHELPRISQKKGDQIIKKGMIFTIEPGIYIGNKFGVRLENIVII